MAVARDTVSPSATAWATAVPITWTHTAGAASTIFITVAFAGSDPTDYAPTCTVDGTAATLVGTEISGDNTVNQGFLAMWSATVTSGAHSIAVDASNTSDSFGAGYAAVGYTGIGTPGTPVISQGDGTPPTITVTTSTGSVVFAAGISGSSITSPSGTVLAGVNDSGSSAGGNFTIMQQTSGTVSYSDGGDDWAMIGINLPAGGATTPSGTGTDSWVATASGTGSAPAIPAGTGTDSWTMTGSGTGDAPDVSPSTGTGTDSWVATASGVGSAPTVPANTGSGTDSWVATASGVGSAPAVAPHTGTGTDAWVADSSGTGSNMVNPPRDINILGTGTLASAWSTDLLASGWSTATINN